MSHPLATQKATLGRMDPVVADARSRSVDLGPVFRAVWNRALDDNRKRRKAARAARKRNR